MAVNRTGVVSTFAKTIVIQPAEQKVSIRIATSLDGKVLEDKAMDLPAAFVTANQNQINKLANAIDDFLVAEGLAVAEPANAVKVANDKIAEARKTIADAKALIEAEKAAAVAEAEVKV